LNGVYRAATVRSVVAGPPAGFSIWLELSRRWIWLVVLLMKRTDV